MLTCHSQNVDSVQNVREIRHECEKLLSRGIQDIRRNKFGEVEKLLKREQHLSVVVNPLTNIRSHENNEVKEIYTNHYTVLTN